MSHSLSVFAHNKVAGSAWVPQIACCLRTIYLPSFLLSYQLLLLLSNSLPLSLSLTLPLPYAYAYAYAYAVTVN